MSGLDSTVEGSQEARHNARLYLIGITASFVGGSAMILAAGIWVKSLSGSSSLAALVSVCIYAPSALGPVAGLVADRVSRQRLLVLVMATTAVAMLPLVAVSSRDEIWLIFVAMTCYGIALTMIDPAEQALFVVMLPAEERQRLNGLRMSLQEGGKLAAPLAGAGLFSLLGGGAVAALTSATFVVAALSIARLRVSEPPRSLSTAGWLPAATAGFGHLWRHRLLRTVTIAAAVAMFGSGVVVAAHFSVVDALDRPPGFLGVITGLQGAGSILAGLTSARVVRRHGETTLLALGLTDGVVGYLLLATGRLPTVLLGAFVLGFALPWSIIALVNLTQRLAPIDLQGRVASATGLLLFAPLPVAQLTGAAAITAVDYRTVYVTVAGVGLATVAAVRLLARERGPTTEAGAGSTS
jgi:MFS family permease